jgi:5-hydroxyisourate hydrolase-like protein (transthyretin family)
VDNTQKTMLVIGGLAAAAFMLLKKSTPVLTEDNLTGVVQNTLTSEFLSGVQVVLSDLNTTTDNTGKYVFPNITKLIGNSVLINFTKSEYVEVNTMITLHAGDNIFNEMLLPGATFTGNVIASDTGLPIAGVLVTVFNYNRNTQVAQVLTNASGNFSFPNTVIFTAGATYVIDFEATNYLTLEVQVTLTGGANNLPEVLIPNTATFKGYVTDVDGVGINGVAIVLTHSHGNQYSASSAGDGSFNKAALPVGDYTITFTKPGYQTVTL